MIDGWSILEDGPVTWLWAATGPKGESIVVMRDGAVFTIGWVPVEILPYAQAAWHDHQREKKAY